ncbi:glycosyltransferase [Flavobacterium saccharophilum]|uniref:Glycosyltransferase involved in cell wall bisynthesis n=1 Tax=Flavobacterium saccharophilum TaxID=29534 RepID=A0A1M7K8C9_9FLAO|nr:glycosyltransferase [Flavobacterium saccharophilum]SHM61243.1 Glycosyltransferase involved in cell wall bisynthesis [Flavobacterium saccharophilum]
MQLEKCDITVVVCCFNSAARLQPTLEHLVNQRLKPELNYELVLVDNNSTDETSGLAANIWRSFNTNINLTVVREPVPGLSYARKTGAGAAKGKIIVFCDDDNWLDENYLQIAFDFMKNHPEVGVLGGKGMAASRIEFPDWFPTYQGDYAVGVQALESGDISSRGYVWGSGMVVRRYEILSLYNAGFSGSLTGRKGSDLQAGDDSEICKWYLIVGKSLYYNELLVFRHYIEAFRLTIEYNKKLNQGFSQSHKALNQYNFIINLLKRERLPFLKIGSLLLLFLLEKNRVKIASLLEFINKTPITFHKPTRKILKSRKVYLENEKQIQ